MIEHTGIQSMSTFSGVISFGVAVTLTFDGRGFSEETAAEKGDPTNE